MASSPVATALSAPDASFIDLNPAACQFFGLDRETLMSTRWEQLIADGFAEVVNQGIADLSEGRTDGIRMVVQYLHADGHLIWGDLSAGCVRSATGEVESFVIQVIDITAEMEGRQLLAESDENNRALAHGLQVKTEQMTSELHSAAMYVASILPSRLDGAVEVRSIYLPSQEVGGDCFDYNWIDDDHLMVYLIDVSGHGIAPALLSISVHNMLRSHSIDRATLLDPALLLSALNDRFQMDRQGGNYFTAWYGVYELSTRTLRYASAGHPPALAFRRGTATPTSLGTAGVPVGMFEGSGFDSESYVVPADSTILIYSDGTFELTDGDGNTWGRGDFTALAQAQFECAGLDLDVLTGSLLQKAGGAFEDDCSMVLLRLR